MRIIQAVLALALMLPLGSTLAQFGHQHEAWTALLGKHVVLISDARASQVPFAVPYTR